MSENTLIIAEISFDVKPYDIDVAGHVNNSVHIRWLEDLRVKLFEKIIPVTELLKKNQYLLVASTQIKYKKQIALTDKPVGKIKLDRIDKVIWVLRAEFIVNNTSVAIAEQKCVIVDLLTNSIQKPPTEVFK